MSHFSSLLRLNAEKAIPSSDNRWGGTNGISVTELDVLLVSAESFLWCPCLLVSVQVVSGPFVSLSPGTISTLSSSTRTPHVMVGVMVVGPLLGRFWPTEGLFPIATESILPTTSCLTVFKQWTLLLKVIVNIYYNSFTFTLCSPNQTSTNLWWFKGLFLTFPRSCDRSLFYGHLLLGRTNIKKTCSHFLPLVWDSSQLLKSRAYIVCFAMWPVCWQQQNENSAPAWLPSNFPS